ncbi:MAG: bifunctional nuclease family protein [Bacillota bacterium]
MISVKIKGVAFDISGNPMILLMDESEQRVLPIWIGVLEANAIAVALEQFTLPRPLTHDLMINLGQSLGATITKVIITDLKDNTFYAEIHLLRDCQEILLDARPSDAIALALRARAPVYINKQVADHMLQITDVIDNAHQEEFEKFAQEIAREYKKTLH